MNELYDDAERQRGCGGGNVVWRFAEMDDLRLCGRSYIVIHYIHSRAKASPQVSYIRPETNCLKMTYL